MTERSWICTRVSRDLHDGRLRMPCVPDAWGEAHRSERPLELSRNRGLDPITDRAPVSERDEVDVLREAQGGEVCSRQRGPAEEDDVVRPDSRDGGESVGDHMIADYLLGVDSESGLDAQSFALIENTGNRLGVIPLWHRVPSGVRSSPAQRG